MNSADTDFNAQPSGTTNGGLYLGTFVTPRSKSAPVAPRLDETLFAEGYRFDFFQAVRLLEKLAPARRPVGHQGTVAEEAIRFRVPASFDFPPSAIARITPPTDRRQTTEMWVNFMGLTGPSGILPRHYTEMLIRRHIDFRGSERYVLRDWLDLFNHRLISLFYRAWEKYRFWIPFERGEHLRSTPDAFTACLRGLIGLGLPSLHNRLQVSIAFPDNQLPDNQTGPSKSEQEQQGPVAARIEDISLMRYAGLLSQRPRNALNLEAILTDYFHVPVTIEQFQGQWLHLESDDQSRLGTCRATGALGNGAIVGPRVWNVQSKFRIRIGPLDWRQFCEFFPDRAPTPVRKLFFLLSQLVRFYAGPEFDFDIQLILRRQEVPSAKLDRHDDIGSRLGWNTWLCSTPPAADAEDAVIASNEMHRLPAIQIDSLSATALTTPIPPT